MIRKCLAPFKTSNNSFVKCVQMHTCNAFELTINKNAKQCNKNDVVHLLHINEQLIDVKKKRFYVFLFLPRFFYVF